VSLAVYGVIIVGSHEVIRGIIKTIEPYTLNNP